MIAENAQAKKLIDAIRDQTEGVPNHMVFVLDIVSVRFGGYFSPSIKAQLQRFEFLQMLTLNDCGIKSLQNFPHLPRLIRLDLVFNEIPGEDLLYIAGSRHIQTLMLGANRIQRLEQLQPLKNMNKILQLDFINNPVSRLPGYREKVYTMFKSLMVLDTLDKGGKDAYANMSMMQTVSRIPDNLFDRAPVIHAPVHVAIHRQQKNNLNRALARTGSLQSMDKKVIKKAVKKADIRPSNAKRAKAKMAIQSNKSTASSRAGILFPVGRIRRHIKTQMQGLRVGRGSAVYMAAVLEYLSAELLQIAGNQAKLQKKTRITPIMIRDCLKSDQQMNELLKNVTMTMV